MYRFLTTVLTTAMLCGPAHAQNDTPCSDPAFRQLDFWVGDWDLSWTNADGTGGRGSNRISRDEYGDCVIYERFSTGDVRGMSVSTYYPAAGVWRQSWVDNQGGYFALSGGPSDSENVHFELRNTRLQDSEPQLRMLWEDVSEDAMTWRWQMLPPDADPDQDPWEDRWVIHYRRKD